MIDTTGMVSDYPFAIALLATTTPGFDKRRCNAIAIGSLPALDVPDFI